MIRSLIRLMRPIDWTKNFFVLPALLFALPSLDTRDSEVLLRLAGNTLLAFIAFCLLTWGFYAINDVLDAESDRGH